MRDDPERFPLIWTREHIGLRLKQQLQCLRVGWQINQLTLIHFLRKQDAGGLAKQYVWPTLLCSPETGLQTA